MRQLQAVRQTRTRGRAVHAGQNTLDGGAIMRLAMASQVSAQGRKMVRCSGVIPRLGCRDMGSDMNMPW